VEEALDLLRAKFHKENDLLAAHGLIEALGLLNTKSAAAEIMQVVKIVRPTLSTKEEVRKRNQRLLGSILKCGIQLFSGIFDTQRDDATPVVQMAQGGTFKPRSKILPEHQTGQRTSQRSSTAASA